MAFLKTIFKKHQKLSDEWRLAPGHEESGGGTAAPGTPGTLEGITFKLKYLGSWPVKEPSSAKLTAEAVQHIVNASKHRNKRTPEVQLAVNLRGVSVLDIEKNSLIMDVSLYRISYCSADATHGHVFAFIAMRNEELLECHAFLCPKRKVAQLISITVAQTFNTAFHLWQMTHTGSMSSSQPDSAARLPSSVGSGKAEKRTNVLQQLIAPVPVLIDLTTPIQDSVVSNTWVTPPKTNFDE